MYKSQDVEGKEGEETKETYQLVGGGLRGERMRVYMILRGSVVGCPFSRNWGIQRRMRFCFGSLWPVQNLKWGVVSQDRVHRQGRGDK